MSAQGSLFAVVLATASSSPRASSTNLNFFNKALKLERAFVNKVRDE